MRILLFGDPDVAARIPMAHPDAGGRIPRIVTFM
jgi:hypothetical protein